MSDKQFTAKQRLFISEYLQCRNATRAAKNAGYSVKTARTIGSHLLTKVDISQAIEKGLREQLEKADISSDHILLALRRIAFSEYGITGKLRALELLGKSLGIFQANTQSSQPIKSTKVNFSNRMKREESVLDLLLLKP